MLLERRACQSTGHGVGRREFELISEDHRTGLHDDCGLFNVEPRCGIVRGSANILPSSAGPYSSILLLIIQMGNHRRRVPGLDTLLSMC